MASRKNLLVMAAVAGIAMGAAQAPLHAQENNNDVKCFGVNSCRAHAGCSVTDGDVGAVKKLLGNTEFKEKFGKTRTHSCGAHASCGAANKFLNWTKVSADQCQQQGGIVIAELGGNKTARKL